MAGLGRAGGGLVAYGSPRGGLICLSLNRRTRAVATTTTAVEAETETESETESESESETGMKTNAVENDNFKPRLGWMIMRLESSAVRRWTVGA